MEGGDTIREAQTCGCPVVTTGCPPMTDVSGSAAVLIDPTKPEDAAFQIAFSRGQRAMLIQAGFANVSRYELQTMVAGYVAAYTTMCNEVHATEAL